MSYASFLWKSSDAHGIHSPFVYSFVANSLYGRPKISLSPEVSAAGLHPQGIQTLFKAIAHFKAFKLMVLGTDTKAVTEAIRSTGELNNTQMWFFSPMASVPGGAELVFLTGTGHAALKEALTRGLEDANNNTVFVINGIYNSPAMQQAWQRLKEHPGITVTIDTYHLGLLFVRSGQANQHFYIRTKTSAPLNFMLGIRNLWGLLG